VDQSVVLLHEVTRRDLPTAFHASAPLRIDFAGGGTDVPPFSAREGGVVVNAAIRLHAHVGLTLGGTVIRLVAEDLGESVECVNLGGLVLDGKLDPLKAALRMFPVLGTFTLTTRCDVSPGAGLGRSGALDVALVAALTRARLERLDARDLADHAWQVEAGETGGRGGKQDQYAAALGGVHRFTFRDPDVGVEPLTLDPAFAAALEQQLLLVSTPAPRGASDVMARVMDAYERGDRAVTGALRAMKDVAEAMVAALRGADLARIATLLAEHWRHQQALDPGVRTQPMARVEQAVMGAGALGGKAVGVGGGGSMFFVMRGAAELRAAAEAAAAAGGTVLPVAWASDGVRAW
jgi:D-glycero-alpha-D-manno-heptose-7-phosphate kinase